MAEDLRRVLGWRLRAAVVATVGVAVAAGWLTRQLPFGDLSLAARASAALFLALLVAGTALAIERWLEGSVEGWSQAVQGRTAPHRVKAQHLEQLIDALPAGLLLVDGENRIRLCNPRLRQLLSLRQDPDGEPLTQLPAADKLQQLAAEARQRGATVFGSLVRPESRYQLDNRRQLTLAAVPMENDGTLILMLDLTDALHRLETHRQLVANVSHELKTPLTAIRGYAETLEDGALERPEVAKLFTGRILEQCQRLEDVLKDLLLVARLESEGSDREAPQAVDLVAALRRGLEVVASQAQAKSVHLQLHVTDPVPPLLGHANELDHLLLNLLENSIKYNRENGRVDVTVSRQGDQLCLEVQDTGIGIPSSDVRRIFERFYRVDKGRSRQQGGTGLGLAIVQQAVALHRGTIAVDSELGSGSCFRVHLPIAPPPEPQEAP